MAKLGQVSVPHLLASISTFKGQVRGEAAGVRTPGAVVATRLRKATGHQRRGGWEQKRKIWETQNFLGGSISIRSYWASIKTNYFGVNSRGTGFWPNPKSNIGNISCQHTIGWVSDTDPCHSVPGCMCTVCQKNINAANSSSIIREL